MWILWVRTRCLGGKPGCKRLVDHEEGVGGFCWQHKERGE